MGKTLLFFMLLSVKLTFGQVVDDFSDGDFLLKPSWIGQVDRFKINDSKQLQSLLSAENQSISLVTKSQLVNNVTWEFFVQLNFDPSVNNQAKIYLMADESDLNGPLNGYFVQIGESGGSDSYDLYRQTGMAITKIIDGVNKLRTDVNKLMARVKVNRDELGNWILYTDVTGGSKFELEGTAKDLQHPHTNWFGVHCRYTATRSTGFIFDDFKIEAQGSDTAAPQLSSAKVIDGTTVELSFSESVDVAAAMAVGNYELRNLGSPSRVVETKLPYVFLLFYPNVLPSGEHHLMVNNVKDLAGNVIVTNSSITFFYVKPYPLQKGDLLISEVLFNPKAGGVDFVEIYNATDQPIDLQQLQLANVDATGAIANIKRVSDQSVYMPAKTYWVLTTDVSNIQSYYEVGHPQQMVQMASLPAFNNDKGTAVLLTDDGILERFVYTEKMHNSLLRDADGVSLERVSFLRDVNEGGNFKSAAMAVGFGTPTSRNSQAEDDMSGGSSVHFASKTFSPDGDGFEDVLRINYEFAQSGQFATVNIYNERGVLIRKLQRNTSIGTTGYFEWDGLTDQSVKGAVGIYIMVFDSFALNGKAKRFRQACVLAAKLN